MKIEGPKKSSPSTGPSKAGGAKPSGDSTFSGMIDDTEEASGHKAVSGVMQIGQLDALLSIQEAADSGSEEAAKKGRRRAAQLLDQLDQVRLGLLSGGIPVATLNQLARTIASHRDNVLDPQLQSLLDDIDLRVQVELAKLGR